jgi:DNA (cytosine-5)-methyltransferase 1
VKAAGGGAVDVAWFSPDCKHFSKAKGGKPVEKGIRDLAWVVVTWAQRVKPTVIFLENVEEFKTWGPLDENQYPDPAKKGQTFAIWKAQLKKLGYKIESRELRACDYGAPTTRKRLFLIARCDGLPIIWPKPTHGPKDSKHVLSGTLKPYRTAADIIDWSIPCPSIFSRKKPLVDATCRRIAAGLVKYVINAQRPFIVPITHRGWGGDRVCDVDTPLNTITTSKGGEFAICEPRVARHDDVAAFMAQHNTGVIGHPMSAPISTITARGTQQNLVTSQLVKLRRNCVGQGVEEPIHTITAGGGHFGEVRAFLVKYYGNDEHGQDITQPLHTIPTKDRFGLVNVWIGDEEYIIADIGMRMLTPRELFLAQGFPEDYIIDPIINGRQMPKTVQIGRCGNAVNPALSRALVAANCSHMMADGLLQTA